MKDTELVAKAMVSLKSIAAEFGAVRRLRGLLPSVLALLAFAPCRRHPGKVAEIATFRRTHGFDRLKRRTNTWN
jgi:hypothetical protein